MKGSYVFDTPLHFMHFTGNKKYKLNNCHINLVSGYSWLKLYSEIIKFLVAHSIQSKISKEEWLKNGCSFNDMHHVEENYNTYSNEHSDHC